MDALRICTHVDSDTLHLPDLKQMIGKDVEIIVLVESPNTRFLKRPRTPGSAKGMMTMADQFQSITKRWPNTSWIDPRRTSDFLRRTLGRRWRQAQSDTGAERPPQPPGSKIEGRSGS